MKENKKRAIFIVVSIILIILILVIYLTVKVDKGKIKNNKPLSEDVIKGINFNEYSYIDTNDEYIIMLKDNKIILNNLINNEEIKTDYNSLVENKKDLLLFKQGKEYILTDNKGNKIDSSNKNNIDIIVDSYTKKSYYVKANTLYDNKGNKILTNNNISDYFYSIHNNLFIISMSNKYIVINIKNNKSLTGIDYYRFNNYLIVRLKDKYWGYDYETNKGTYYKKLIEDEPNYYILSNDNEKIYFNNDEKIASDIDLKKIILNDNYYLEYNNGCGKLTRSKDKKVLINECILDYNKSKYNENLVTLNTRNKNDDSYVLFQNGTVKKFNGRTSYKNNYIIYYKDYVTDWNGNTYNLDGNKIESDCTNNLNQIDENNYYCYNGVYYNLLDNKLNVINKYDEIKCNGEYCSIKIDDNYGLLYKKEELIAPKYKSIIVTEKYIIIDNLYGINIFLKDEINNSNKKISIDESEYDVDIDYVVNEYKLQKIQDIINDNKELFKKYYYVVKNNKNLGIYDKAVLKLFKVVVDNKEYLEENYFLDKLSKLKIKVVDKLGTNILGEYADNELLIKLLKGWDEESTVYYHELIHFLDYRLNEQKQGYYSKEENKYLFKDEVGKLDKEKRLKVLNEKNYILIGDEYFTLAGYNRFKVEGGTEYYMATYFNQGIHRTYDIPVRTYIAFDYLFGCDEMKKVFFSSKGDFYLVNLFLENGISSKEIYELEQLLYNVNMKENNKNIIKITDLLINVYNNKYNKSWTSDNEFTFIIACLINEVDLSKITSKNKSDYINIVKTYNSMYIEELEYNLEEFDYYYHRENEKTYMIVDDFYKVEYDFKNQKVLNVDTIEYEVS